jgi:hypothetical protein
VIDPAGIAGVDIAFGVGLELRHAGAGSARRERMARHHRSAQRQRARSGPRDLGNENGIGAIAWRGDRESGQRDGDTVGVATGAD